MPGAITKKELTGVVKTEFGGVRTKRERPDRCHGEETGRIARARVPSDSVVELSDDE